MLTGEYHKDELLEAARSGAEDRLLALLTPLNVNCHASDGRRSTPLHLAAGYNRIRIVQILLQHGADVHAKVIIAVVRCPVRRLTDIVCSIFEKGQRWTGSSTQCLFVWAL